MKKLNVKNLLTFLVIELFALIRTYKAYTFDIEGLETEKYIAETIIEFGLLFLGIAYAIMAKRGLANKDKVLVIINMVLDAVVAFALIMSIENLNLYSMMCASGFSLVSCIISHTNRDNTPKTFLKEFLIATIIIGTITGIICSLFYKNSSDFSSSLNLYNRNFNYNVNALVSNKDLINGTEENSMKYIFTIRDNVDEDEEYSFVDKNFNEIKRVSRRDIHQYWTNGNHAGQYDFLELYKSRELMAVVGIVYDESVNKCVLINRNMQTICEIKNIKDDVHEYIYNLFNYAITEGLLDYDSIYKNFEEADDYSCPDGSILFYNDSDEHGYIDKNEIKHMDSDNSIITMGVYENNVVVYDRTRSNFMIYNKEYPKEYMKVYNFAYCYDNYIIGCTSDYYEFLNPDDLSVIIIIEKKQKEEYSVYRYYLEDVKVYDDEETIFLRDSGYKVLKYNKEDNTVEIVLDNIYNFKDLYEENEYPNSLYSKNVIEDNSKVKYNYY